MSKVVLIGSVTKTQEIVNDFQAVVFHNVSKDATIKITESTNGKPENVRIPTAVLGVVVEAQDKIDFLQSGKAVLRRILEVDTDNGAVKALVMVNTKLSFGVGGEKKLTSEDKVFVELKNLAKITADSYVSEFGSESLATSVIHWDKVNYVQAKDKQDVSLLGVSFVVFPTAKLPEFLEFKKGKEGRKVSMEDLLLEQEEIFGLVRKTYMQDASVIDEYGAVDCLLIPTAHLDALTVHDEGQAQDFQFYTIKL